MGKSKYKTLFKDVIIFGIGTVGSKLIMFFMLPLYTNVLTRAEYGVGDLVFSISELVRPFASLAIYNGLLRYGLSEEYRKEDTLRCATSVFVIGSIFLLLVTPLFKFYDAISSWKWYLSTYAIAVFASKNVMIYLKIENKNKLYSIFNVLQALVLALSNIFFLMFLNAGIKGYLLANSLAPIFIAVAVFFVGGMHKELRKSQYDANLMKTMIRYSLPFIINDISWWAIHSSDKFMLERMMDTDALGIYATATKIPLLVSVVMSIFGQAWDLSVIRSFERREDGNGFHETIYKYFIILAFGLCIFIVMIIKPFMNIYVGASFQNSWKYVPLLLVASVFAAINTILVSFFSARKKSTHIMLPTIVGGIVNIILNYILIPRIGIFGAVTGTICTYFLMLCIFIYEVGKIMKFNLHIGFLCSAVALILIQAIMVCLDFYGWVVSGIVVLIYVLITKKDLMIIVGLFMDKVFNRRRYLG